MSDKNIMIDKTPEEEYKSLVIDLNTLLATEMKSLCQQRGMTQTGVKQELRDRLGQLALPTNNPHTNRRYIIPTREHIRAMKMDKLVKLARGGALKYNKQNKEPLVDLIMASFTVERIESMFSNNGLSPIKEQLSNPSPTMTTTITAAAAAAAAAAVAAVAVTDAAGTAATTTTTTTTKTKTTKPERKRKLEEKEEKPHKKKKKKSQIPSQPPSPLTTTTTTIHPVSITTTTTTSGDGQQQQQQQQEQQQQQQELPEQQQQQTSPSSSLSSSQSGLKDLYGEIFGTPICLKAYKNIGWRVDGIPATIPNEGSLRDEKLRVKISLFLELI